jgi:FkbH-like protein
LDAIQRGDLENDIVKSGFRRLASMRLGDGERLLLKRIVAAARALPNSVPGFRPFRVLMVSNRTLSFFASDLEVAGAARGLLIETVEAPYDSIAALALTPSAAGAFGRFDAVFVLFDAAFLPGGNALLDRAREADTFESIRDHIFSIVTGLQTKLMAPVITATVVPPSASVIASADTQIVGTISRSVAFANNVIASLATEGRVILFDLAAVAAWIGTASFFDPVRFYQAKVPFAPQFGSVVADKLAALIGAMAGLSARALVLDLDNTIWGGVVADDGIDQIKIGQGSPEAEAFYAVQQYALELRRRGIVLAVCSKNHEDIAREPFRSHPDMLLREGDFAMFVANFDDKATNVSRIAKALDLDPSSLVFLDDNPAERERVRSALPAVMVPEVGDDPSEFIPVLNACGSFEHLPLTADDLGRAAAYQARSEAKALQAKIGNYGDYLSSLDMELIIAPFDSIGCPRIAQLIQKSNQFNLTTKRYSEVEIAAMQNDSTRLGWQVRLKDRFADHGVISVIIAEKEAARWTIDTWVMSCRVLERGVERAVMNSLICAAKQAGVELLAGSYRPTARNVLVSSFFPGMGFQASGTRADGEQLYSLDLDTVSQGEVRMKVLLAEGTGRPEFV